jgi:hypothetical protein
MSSPLRPDEALHMAFAHRVVASEGFQLDPDRLLADKAVTNSDRLGNHARLASLQDVLKSQGLGERQDYGLAW